MKNIKTILKDIKIHIAKITVNGVMSWEETINIEEAEEKILNLIPSSEEYAVILADFIQEKTNIAEENNIDPGVIPTEINITELGINCKNFTIKKLKGE